MDPAAMASTEDDNVSRAALDKLDALVAAASVAATAVSDNQFLPRAASAEPALGIDVASLGKQVSAAGALSRRLSLGGRKAVTSPGKIRLPGQSNSHIPKWRSAQVKLDIDDYVTSGAALSRASSASLGFSFSFTGFTPPPVDVAAELQVSSDEENGEPGIDSAAEATSKRNNIVAEPTHAIYLKFSEVKYTVCTKGLRSSSEKRILNGISGAACPGEVLALMGPSGSGKTTLLSILGGRTRVKPMEGCVTYNDEPYNKTLRSRIGFVTQDDVLFAHLTVRETLTYAALLRLPSTMTRKEKEDKAIDIIFELGLERCMDTMIGGSYVRGVSGGERKRVCIGAEIIVGPSLLFLDEPTSGLDSTTALKIVQILRDIAKGGKTVVTTIHQPSSRLYHNFDALILLGKGSLLYSGKAAEALPYFHSIGCAPLIPMNPAEFLMDLANGNMADVSVPSELHDRVLTESLRTDAKIRKPSPKDVHEYLVEAYEARAANGEKNQVSITLAVAENAKTAAGAGWWQQYFILFSRGLKERRHDYLSWTRSTQVVATAVILGLLWWQSRPQDQVGLLFFIAVFWGFFPVFTAIFTFPQERAMLNKERAVGMYKLSAYFMARTTSDLPLDLFLPTIFMVIVYFMAGLRQTAGAFFLSLLTVFLSIVAAQGLGLAVGATMMDIKKATTLASVTVMTFMLAGGFFVKRIPVFISWLRYLSFNYHTFRLLLKVQYNHAQAYLNAEELDSGVEEVVALLAMVVGYRLLAYISLKMMKLQS